MVSYRKSRKGAVSMLPEIILIIFALALGLLLYGIAGKFTGKEVRGVYDGEVLDGDPEFVYKALSKLLSDCWTKNDRGNAPNSDVCYRIRLSATDNLDEYEFNEFHDCEYLPNNYLNMNTKTDTDCGDKDKIYWEITHNDTDIKITYSGSKRRIEIIEEGAGFVDDGCLEKCNAICEEAINQCDDEMATCTVDCEAKHDECVRTSEELAATCKFICTDG